METEEELDLEVEGEEEPIEGQALEGEEGGTPAPKPDAALDELKLQIAELKGASGATKDLPALLEFGRQFLERQNNAPRAPNPEDDEKYAQFGQAIQDAVLKQEPKEAGKAIALMLKEFGERTADGVVSQRTSAATEKAGEFAVQMYLSAKKDESGTSGEKLHRVIAKDFALSKQERAWVATASAEDTKAFLDRRYRESAGEVLLNSRKNARPKDISGGQGNGKGGGQTTAFAAGTGEDEFAKLLWPDDKIRAEKIKKIAPRLKEAG